MSNVQPRGRRALAAVMAAAMLSAVALAFAPAANAATTATARLSGANRYSTAVDVADEFGAATHVIVASGENFPDAMTAAGYAGKVGAPILLTQPNTLTPETDAKLRALPNPAVTVAGGTGAISAAVFSAIDAATTGSVTRLEGPTRYETACAMANAISSGSIGSVDGKKSAVVATGLNYPDALAAGVLAAEKNLPVYLVNSSVPSCVTTSLTTNGIQQVIIAGGTGVVSSSVEVQLETTTGNPAVRYGGANRNDTAAKIADGALASFAFDGKDVLLAYGRNFPDALAAGPYGALVNAPILLTSSLPAETSAWLSAHASTLNQGTTTAIGGLGVIDAATLSAAAAASTPGTPTTNQTFSVTPVAAEEKAASASAATDEGRRSYSVSIPNTVTDVNIALVPKSVVTDTSGTIKFSANAAVTQTNNSPALEVVNGTTLTAAGTGGSVVVRNDVAPVGGIVSFTVDSIGPVELIPVVYEDTLNDGTNLLDLNSDGTPSEKFGVGGAITYLPTAAPSATNPDAGRVGFLDESGNRVGIDTGQGTIGDYDFAATDFLYTYDSNDTFQIVGIPASMAAFEAALSRGDVLDPGAYSSDSSAVSVFNISADGPTIPTTVTSEKGGSGLENDITVVITISQPSTMTQYDSFVIQRAPVTGGTDEANDGTQGTFATVGSPLRTADEDAVAGTFTWTDKSVPVGVYRYRAQGVIDGDVPGTLAAEYRADSNNESSTTPTADATAPTTQYRAVTTDTGFQQVADTGDVFRFIMSEVVTSASNASMRITEQNANAESFTLTNGGNATFTLNASATVIGGTSYAAGRILTVTLTSKPTPIATVTGGDNELRYDGTVPNVTNASGIADAAGNPWAPTADAILRHVVAPSINAGTGDESDDLMTLTYTQPVRCVNDAATRAQFVYKTVNPTVVTCNGTTTVVLTFADTVITDADDASTLTYTQSATATARVEGLNSRTATSPQTTAAIVNAA